MATKQNTGVVDSSGNPVLDGSGNPVMSGRFPDEDEITARGRARNAAMFKSFANRLTGKKEEAKKAAPAVSRPTRPGQETSGSKPAASRPTRPGQQVSGQSFGQAFAAARKAGDKTFTFKGKSFTTETKEDVAKRAGTASAGKAKTASEYSDSTDAMRNRSRMAANSANKKSSTTDDLRAKSRREARFQGSKRMAKTPEGQAKRKAQETDQAIKRVTPESGLIGGGASFGLKALQSGAKNLANTGARTTAKTTGTATKSPLRQKTEELIKGDKNPGRSVSPATSGSSLKDRTKELIRDDRAAKSNELSRQMAAQQTPTKFASKSKAAPRKSKKFNEEEAGIEFKRGGKVCMASKRADGIAQRGKTRGKVY